ncbi:beta-ketoacyl synthase domain-containing protein [Xylariaceae sp. FL0662B]|nr:beta-ketoacyl synthase domain-containing protein [Xylariaceae sp. FL0662B]
MYKQPCSEAIAIVGSGCRFAGDATSPSRLWDVLSKAPDLSREVPANRFNAKGFYHVDGEYHGTTNSIKAYWLNQDHRVFDAGFFNITPKEAEAIDPQQRLLLEVVYEAMESAGYTLNQYSGKEVAVFAGVMTADYDTLSQRDELWTSQYYATGNARSIISNRISYFFNFHGPSMTIDTACSSSLVALHQAVLSLRTGESTMACVTGVNLMLTPEQFIVESSLHMLSPTGKSRMWDVDADGYARGEGVAAVFLKPLSRALADGDQIEAIIRETGVNSDGRTNGVTMPNPVAQTTLIRNTYLKAGLDPQRPEDQCQYFEAHGTGTHAGDPREATAINDAFFASRAEEAMTSVDVPNPKKMLVGSVKTVIGHTEGAAGLAGLLKVVQAMKHGLVPPNLHLNSLSPSVEPSCACLEVPTSLVPWPKPSAGQPKRASLNSFGFGGANAHAILESYEPDIHNELGQLPARDKLIRLNSSELSPGDAGSTSFFLPLLLSASSQKSLGAVIRSYKDYLLQHQTVHFDELARALFSRRTALKYRVALSATSGSQALEKLDEILEKSASNKDIGTRSETMTEPLKILGIFTGQGAQWPTMSRSLIRTNKVYRETIRNLDEVLRSCSRPPSWTLEGQIMEEKDVSRMHEAAISQPLCTAIQIALVDLLRSLRINFHTVVGHSSGEIGAAYAAGKLSAKDAMLIAYLRGFVGPYAGGPNGEEGGMLAAGLSESEGLGFCRDPMFDGRLVLAASNAPSSVTISGDLNMIKLAHEELTKQKKFSRLLKVDVAYHSPHMSRAADEYIKSLQDCEISPDAEGNGVVWVSSVYGFARTDEKDLGSGYWRDNMLYTVQFHDAVVNALTEYGPYDCALEVGPHPALKGPFTQTAKSLGNNAISYSSLLDRSKDDSLAFSDFLGSMWSRFGPLEVDFCNYIDQSPKPSVLKFDFTDLPPYPWDHSQVHYRESRISRQFQFKTDAPHELLGVRARDDNEHELRWRNVLKVDKLPWAEHHSFQGQALIPASAYCVMALDAARSLLNGKRASVVELQDMRITSGLSAERDTPGVETQFSLTVLPSQKDGKTDSIIEADFSLISCPADGTTTMTKNMEGTLRIYLDEPTVDALPARCASQSETLPASPEGFYKMMDETGLVYSGPFRSIETIQRRYKYCSATLRRRHPADTTTLQTSPAMLDSCFQSAFLSYASPGDKSLWTSFLPTSIERLRFNLATQKPTDEASEKDILTIDTHMAEVKPPTADSKAMFVVDLGVFNQTGCMEIQVEGLTVTALAHTTPKDDYELYLHTVVDVDPVDEIVQANVQSLEAVDPDLVESCARVATFFVRDSCEPHERSSDFVYPYGSPARSIVSYLENINPDHWSSDTREIVDKFILDSNYYTCLDFIRELSGSKPDLLPRTLPLIIEDMHCLSHFSGHIGRIVQQIAHRYPRMNILSLIEPETVHLGSIISSVGSSFSSFTIGSETAHNLDKHIQMSDSANNNVVSLPLDLTKDFKAQLGREELHDLVLLSASQVENKKATDILENIQATMKPGGYLVLLQLFNSPLKDRIRRSVNGRDDVHEPSTPPEWPDILDDYGFVQIAKNSDQSYHPGFSLIIRQLNSPILKLIKDPSQQQGKAVTAHLLLITSTSHDGVLLSRALELRLRDFCDQVSTRNVDDLDTQVINHCTAAIILADLDEPLMSTMTEQRLQQLRELLRPNMTVLWLTHDARFGNPDHVSTIGFTRTIAAETPNLTLQVLDLDDEGKSVPIIFETFMQLVAVSEDGEDDKEALWIQEPEIHFENGRRLIPRVVPLKQANDHINSTRRVVSIPANTLRESIEIVPARNPDGLVRYETRKSDCDPRNVTADKVTIQVDYSSVEAIRLNAETAIYLCSGRNISTNEYTLAFSVNNSSYMSLPASHVAPLLSWLNPQFGLPLIGIAARHIMVQVMICLAGNKSIILIDPDVELATFAVEATLKRGHGVTSYTTSRAGVKDRSPLLFLHPHASTREIKAIFPTAGAHVFNFQPEDTGLSQKIIELLPKNCHHHSRSSLFGSRNSDVKQNLSSFAENWLKMVTEVVEEALYRFRPLPNPNVISLPVLQSGNANTSPFQVIDWRANRTVLRLTQSVEAVGPSLFHADRTYVLTGLTRDFGQSLCRLFIGYGARHIVLASRKPAMTPHWIGELARSHGADVQIHKLDVTQYDDVQAFRARLQESGHPPVAGIVNGAMVLRDRVFAQMDIDTWHAVLRPKTVGSKNLDRAFADDGLDFFIMTSSFAAMGGHPGQSNYAAANAYMNGLAANRRRRGLAGSVLNIGVVYGLGFLAREREELYAGLERDGYPPISERELHCMFLEAILAGRPDLPDQPYDITTGLRRFDPDDPNLLHWQRDPRFGHFALKSSSLDDGEGKNDSTPKQSLKEVLAGLTEVDAMAQAILERFAERLEAMLQLPQGSVHADHGITELGVDSLIAVEIRNWIWKAVGRDVSVLKILATRNIHKLCLELAEQSLVARNKGADATAATEGAA